jgi:hypothetical protein
VTTNYDESISNLNNHCSVLINSFLFSLINIFVYKASYNSIQIVALIVGLACVVALELA